MSVAHIGKDGESSRYRKMILQLSWPILLEQLLASMVNVVDSAMVGALGKNATAAVAINYAPTMLVDGISMALGVGYTSLIARSIGAGDEKRARALSGQSLLVTVAIGLPVALVWFSLGRLIPVWMGGAPEILDTAEHYNKILALSIVFKWLTMVISAVFRGYGNSRTPMAVNGMVQITNVVGNFLMILPTRDMEVLGHTFRVFGLGWGVEGAAISSSLANILGGIVLLALCFKPSLEMHLTRKGPFSLRVTELREVLDISFPAMLERFTMSIAFIVVSRTITALGTAALAAYNLSGTAESLSFMPAFAFGVATTTLFGQAIGARDSRKAHRLVIESIKVGTVIMAVMTVVLFVGSTRIMGFFTPDAEVIQKGSTLLKILAVIQIPQMIAVVYSGALKGAGDSKSSFLIALISMWGIRLCGTVFCVQVLDLGLYSACVCMCTDNVARCILFHLRYHQGKWKSGEGRAAGTQTTQ